MEGEQIRQTPGVEMSIKDSNARKSNNFPVNFGDVCGISKRWNWHP